MKNSPINIKNSIVKVLFFMVFCLFCITGYGQTGTDFSGSYLSHSNTGDIKLNLSQSYEGIVTGDLTGTDGNEFKIEGEIIEGGIGGFCFNNDIYVYFEAEFEQENLSFFLIEPDINNMPDYNNVSQLLFTRSAKVPQQQKSSGQTALNEETQNNTAKQAGNQNLTGKMLSHPSWGYKALLPEGWTYQIDENSLIIGHEKIAGMIVCFPHDFKNMEEVHHLLNQGITKEGTNLNISGTIQTLSPNVLYADYTGTIDKTQAKAKGYGTLSPYGGGAFILAASTPEGYTSELEATASRLAKDLQYVKKESSDLMKHFAGKWTRYTKYSTSSIYFGADGTYANNYESSHQGEFTNETAGGTWAWSTLGQNNSEGNWTISGTKEQGQIIVNMNDGSQIIYDYKVNIENGKVYYNNYIFNGDYYSK